MWVLDATSALVLAALLGGAAAWLITSRRARQVSRFGLEGQAAVWRHPAGRARTPVADGGLSDPLVPSAAQAPKGPDDDPEFIRALEQRIRGDRGEPV